MQLAIGCGLVEYGGGVAYQCLDFSVEYQFLLQSEDKERCVLTVSAIVQGLDASGIPRGSISDPVVVNAVIKHFDLIVGPFLTP